MVATIWRKTKTLLFFRSIVCSIALFLFPFSSSLWMAAGLLWILDAGNNTAMEPYRAFIADKLDKSQQPLGFQAQSFFTGFGQTLANVSLFIFPLFLLELPENYQLGCLLLFFLVHFVLSLPFGGVHIPQKEIPPSEAEIALIKSESLSILTPFIDIISAIKHMPKVMWQLALVYCFNVCVVLLLAKFVKSIALSVWNTTPQQNSKLYEEAVG